MVQGADTYSFGYNGLGDRLQQTVNGTPTSYTLDLNAILTQVLDDGTNAYLYGIGRIGEEHLNGWAYQVADALGSVRQLTDVQASVNLAHTYEPFGELMSSSGTAGTVYNFTGEWRDARGLIYLRASYLDPSTGRFLTTDPWKANLQIPRILNKYIYAVDNPIKFIDPTGMIPARLAVLAAQITYSKVGLFRNCLFYSDDGQWDSDGVGDLFTDYI